MKKWAVSLSCLLLVPLTAFADTGFVYKGDLNGDGIEDSIQSGPSGLFGNAGGPCVVSVSVSPKEYKKGMVDCSSWGFLLERSTNKLWPARYWSYMRHGGGQGSIGATTLDGKFTTQYITLYDMMGAEADTLGKAILKVVNEKAELIKFDQVDNYTPPEQPCGAQWGKSC
jgi:hypothetical protein